MSAAVVRAVREAIVALEHLARTLEAEEEAPDSNREGRGELDPAPWWQAHETAPCGCGIWARCEEHERTRIRGCMCNGPVHSLSCTIRSHRKRAGEQRMAKEPHLE